MARKGKEPVKQKMSSTSILPLFVITVSVVFAILYTVILMPSLSSQIKALPLFIMLLIVSSTVASTVAVVFYLIFKKEI